MKPYILPLFLSATLLAVSCEKVIDVDLNDAATRMVITGTVTNETGPFHVEIRKTVNFDEPNQYPPVTGALVVITDDAGGLDTLTETRPGHYASPYPTQGQPGRTYTLHVRAEGQHHVATSTMPAPVAFESLQITKTPVFGENQYILLPEFTDPAGASNFYRFIQYNDSIPQHTMFLLDDTFIDGNHVYPPLYADSIPPRGHTVTLEMRGIDRATYKYLSALHSTAGNGSVPANPDNQFGGTALGYFSAYTVERRTVVIEE